MSTPEFSIQEQFIQFSRKHLPKYMVRFLNIPWIVRIIGRLLCIEEIFELRDRFSNLSNFELINAINKYSGLSYIPENLHRIPSHGRLLIVANHPLGGADWLLIVQCISSIRKDIKVVINKDVHTLIVNLRDLFIPVDTYAAFNDIARKQIGESLEREEAVLIFPSGGISIFTLKGIADRKWKNGVALFSREHHTDVLPVFIGGRFSLAFYLYPIRLRRFLLVRNLLHNTPKNTRIIIGDRISHVRLSDDKDLSVVSSGLRTATYQLGKKSLFLKRKTE